MYVRLYVCDPTHPVYFRPDMEAALLWAISLGNIIADTDQWQLDVSVAGAEAIFPTKKLKDPCGS